jgi:hypothetical protein
MKDDIEYKRNKIYLQIHVPSNMAAGGSSRNRPSDWSVTVPNFEMSWFHHAYAALANKHNDYTVNLD